MANSQPLPRSHDWWDKPWMDRLVFECPNCPITQAVAAADTQAGIRLWCPRCNTEMDAGVPDE